MLSLLWLELNPWSDMYTKILQANIYDLRSGSVVKNPSANAGTTGSNPGLGRSPGEGIVNPPPYSCLENPIDRGAWQCIQSLGLQKSWLGLSN